MVHRFTGGPQNVPVVITGTGWRQGSTCLVTHGTVAGVKKQSQKPGGLVKEQTGQTGFPGASVVPTQGD